MVARSRLSRSSRLGGVDSRLRSSIASNLKTLPTERLRKYATMSKGMVGGNPVLSLTKAEAQHELLSRQKEMLVWEKGAGALAKKEPLASRIAKGFRRALELAGRGVREYGKVISGEKARELEESIATVGLKGKEKAAYLKQHRKERVAADVDAPFGSFPHEKDVPDFRLADVVQEGHRELQRARKEALS